MEVDAFSAFSSCDQDGDGFITQAEMHYWLSGSLQARGQSEVEADVHAQEAVLLAFQHVDRNQDQLLSFNEFKNWFVSFQRNNFSPAAPSAAVALPRANNGAYMVPGYHSDAGTSGGGVISRHRRTAMESGFEVRVPSATFCVWANSGNGGHPHNEIMMMNQAPPQAQALNTLDYSILKRYNSKKKSTFVAYGIEVTPSGGGSSWYVLKRYSSIASFVANAKAQLLASSGRAPVKSLLQKHPVSDAHFPPKIMGKVNVEKRRLQLEWFLRVFLREPRMQHLPITQSFFQATDADLPDAFGSPPPLTAPFALPGLGHVHGSFPPPPPFSSSSSAYGPPGSALSQFNGHNGGGVGGPRSDMTRSSQMLPSPYTTLNNNQWIPSSSSASSSSVYHESTGMSSQQQAGFSPPMGRQAGPHSRADGSMGYPSGSANPLPPPLSVPPSSMYPPQSQPLSSFPDSSSSHAVPDAQVPPSEKLAALGLSLPLPLPQCLHRVPPPQPKHSGPQPSSSSNVMRSASCTVQVTVPLSAVTNQRIKPQSSSSNDKSDNGGLAWSAEREMGLQILAQLQLASRRNLSSVTVLSVSASSAPSSFTSSQARGALPGAASKVPVGFLHATKALLREVLGSRGRAICDGRTESDLLAFFRQADTDGDGVLSVSEMQTVLQALNLPCDPQMVEATLAIADLDGNGTLDYSEFVNFVCQARGNKTNSSSADSYDEEARLFETFGLFDKDGDGKLSPSDLINALRDQGQTVTFDEVERIIAKATQGSGQPYLLFRDFQYLMSSNHTKDYANIGGRAQPGAAFSASPAVVVVAHVSIDDTQAAAETLFERLSGPGGLRLRKLGREVSSKNASSAPPNGNQQSRPQTGGGGRASKSQVVGGGTRTFRVSKQAPWLVTWRKGGLKSRLTGKLDLRLVTDVVPGGHAASSTSSSSGSRGNAGYGGNSGYGSEYGNSYGKGNYGGQSDYGANYGTAYGFGLDSGRSAPHASSSNNRSSVLGGNAQLHLFLISPVGCLGIAANNTEDHRMLLDGFRRLRLRVRYYSTTTFSSGAANKHIGNGGAMSGPLALAAAESSLLDAFGACDARGSGRLDRATLGRVLWAQGYRIPEGDLQGLVGEFSEEATLDYRQFAANVIALTDPETHAKEAAEQSFLDLLLPLDHSGRGLVPASDIVRVWQAQSPSHGIGGDSGSSSSGGASQDILDFALSSAAVASSTHAMNRNHDNGGNSFSVGDSGQFQGEENEFIDVRAFARIASGVDTRAALAFEQWQVRKCNESAQQVNSAYLEKRTVFAVEMLERYNDPTGGPQGAISQANLGLTLSDLNLRINDALSAAIARAPVHKGRGPLLGTLKWRDTTIHQVLGALVVEADEHTWLRAFDRWDRNRDGTLSIHEVEKALAAGVATEGISGGAEDDVMNGSGVSSDVHLRTRAEVESLVRAADINLDGKISREEFLAVMKLSELNAH